jgi:hypothetical protein
MIITYLFIETSKNYVLQRNIMLQNPHKMSIGTSEHYMLQSQQKRAMSTTEHYNDKSPQK